ncbi:amino acid adenylation domain-containing protein [Nocardia sp. NPDC059764]|uniref:non-ribosomal peptide synthetase n=1 Tax=Nocardia sp. NPDC059764 TaxID=3346939 RepID=UPI00365A4D2C
MTSTFTTDFVLGPIQRAYLVGDQDGLELRGPARYYLACDIDIALVAGIQERLDRLVREHPILRMAVGADLTPTPIGDGSGLVVEQWIVTESALDSTDARVSDEFRSDDLEFATWPQLRVAVVASPRRARIHLVYAMWLMDAASLSQFLRGLISEKPVTAVDPGWRAVDRRRRERDENYWRAVAPTLPDAAEVPLRPGWRQSHRAITHRMLCFDAAVATRIAARGRAHGLTVPMIYLTVYGTLLGAVGGGVAHTITVLRSQRDRSGAEGAIGNYGGTAPLAIPELCGQDFVTLAREVQSRFLEQSFHTSLSGAEIARLGDSATSFQRLAHPFAFTAVETDSVREVAAGLRRDWDTVQLRVPQVLIDHQVVMDSDGSIRLGFDWRSAAFDAGFMDDFVDSYARIVADLADTEFAWVGPPEPEAIAAAPTIAAPAGPGATLHRRILETAARTPDAPAVRDDRGEITYATLAAAAIDLAQRLRDAGASRGDHVGIHQSRGREQVVAILGTLLAGCVYVPLDLGLPDGRLDRIARHADIRFALTDGTADIDDRWRVRGVLPLQAMVFESVRAAPADPEYDAAAVAYVIFTSGSTGEPKGVVIRHDAALNTIDAINALLELRPHDSVLSVSSIGFDLSVYDVFGPLLVGGTVAMLSESTARTPAAWARVVADHGVTVWNSAPALAALLAEQGGALPSIRAYMLSGDWIPLTLPAGLNRLSPDAEMISLGGATEGSIWSIHHRITPADCTGRSIPYGRPLSGQDILVLDPDRRSCPDWHIGEIYIAGAGVADGYLNDPERTAAAFAHDPRYGWIYRTGDRGRRAPDGVIEFLGRVDSQVKVNGYRVELGEIESALTATGYARRCAASVSADGRGVVAYLTLSATAGADWRRAITAALRDELPSYMVPYALIEVDEIPLTSNGKVDYRGLRSLAPILDADPDATAAPEETGMHSQEVSACWSTILGRPAGTQNFFDAGGSSFDAIRLLSLLRSRWGYEVSFGEFLTDPTIAGLATMCAHARSGNSSAVWSFAPRAVASPRGRVILFPPVGGGVSCYSPVISGLPADFDVHVIGMDRPQDVPAADLPALAAVCLAALPVELENSDIPCVFVGWSFGGALAYEAAGRNTYDVRTVVVIDTPVTAPARHRGATEAELIDGFIGDIARAGGVDVGTEAINVDPALRNRFEVYRQNLLLLRDWTPTPRTTPVVELRAREQPAEIDPNGWRHNAGHVTTDVLDGGHFEVFEPTNAQRVRAAIENGIL